MTDITELVDTPELMDLPDQVDPGIEIIQQTPYIFASVGTDHHPFDRFVSWLDGWQEQHGDCEVFIQRGTTELVPQAGSAQWLDPADLRAKMQRADAIVCHGGPSTIMEARKAGITPVVIPRDPAMGEHVDEHQLRFAEFMAAKGAIHLVRSESELSDHLRGVIEGDAERVIAGTPPETLDCISLVIEEVMARPLRPLWRPKLSWS